MPYSVKKKNELPKNVQGMDPAAQKKWVSTFNSVLDESGDEKKAFKIANGTAKKKELFTELGFTTASKGLVPSLWDVDDRQVPQDDANYSPFGATGGKGCATCQFFISPDTCLVVAGDISPVGISKYYTPVVEYTQEPLLVTIVGGDKEQTTPAESIISRFTKFVKGLVSTTPESVPPFRIEKTLDGYRTYYIYSNNFKDAHHQIISEAAHKEYVAWVDQTKLYPEQHLWHAGPLSRFGSIDCIDYVDGFMFATGMVDPDKHHIAEALKEKQDELATSHGFYGLIEPQTQIYNLYRVFEIGPLPVGAEANKWTSIGVDLVHKENMMPFTPAKKAFLKDIAKLSDTQITAMETSLKDLSGTLKAQNIEFKEEAITGEQPAAVEGAPDAAVVAANTAATAEGNTLIIGSIAEMTKALAGLAQLVQSQGTAFTKEITDLKTAQTKSAEQIVEEANTSRLAATPSGFSAARSTETVVQTKEGAAAGQKDGDASWFFNTVIAPLNNPTLLAQAAASEQPTTPPATSNGAS